MPTVSVSLPDDIYIRLYEEARKRGVKVSAIIREILQKHLSGNITTVDYPVEIKPAIEIKEEPKKENPKKEEPKEDDYMNRLKRASTYVKKIIKKDGEIKEDQLQYILKKFGIEKFDLLQEAELYEPEPGIYKPIE